MTTFLSLMTLVLLEVVLGVDNLIFLAVLTARLPINERKSARRFGLSLAWVTRIALLIAAMGMVQLSKPLILVGNWSFSARDLFLIVGGLFLIWKAGQEIWNDLQSSRHVNEKKAKMGGAKVAIFKKPTFWSIVIQVGVMDMVFSIDSVLTAIGLTPNFVVMAVAITIAIIVMIFASEPASHFVERYPMVKLIGLCFLILVGVFLVADGFAYHIQREYLYFALGFSMVIELLRRLHHAHD